MPLDQQPQGEELGMDMIAKIKLQEEKDAKLEEYSKDFARLQKQKSRKQGGVEARVLKSRAWRWGEQYVTQSPRGLVSGLVASDNAMEDNNKLHLVFNLIDTAASKLAGRLTAIGGEFYTRPDKQDPQALSEAEVCDKLILALDEKVDQPARMWELVDTLLTDGVAVEYVPWVPNATTESMPVYDEQGGLTFKFLPTGEVIGEAQKDQMLQANPQIPPESFELNEEVQPTGEVGSEIYGALNVFVDQGVRSFEDLAPDQAVYFAKIRTLGWIQETYGEQTDLTGLEELLGDDLNIVTTSVFQEGDAAASMFLKDMIPMYQGTQAEDDPPQAVVVERFQPASKTYPTGRITCFIPGTFMLYDGENPYGEIPAVDFHLKPVTATFWTKDFITDLIVPQKFINKRFSQIGEQANASIYDKLLLGATIDSKDINPDSPQAIKNSVSETGIPLIQRLAGPQLPSWFLQSIEMTTKMFMQIAGGSDLFSEAQFPGQMRGPMAVPLLQEILDSQWGPLYKHMGYRLARVKQMRLNRVRDFYPPCRTLHYTNRDERDETLVFHKDKVFGRGTNFNVTVERSSLIPEFKAMREMRLADRLNSPLGIIYTDERTGALDKSKIAMALQEGDFAREGKEAQSRKFARQLIEKLWQGQNVPPVLQFWDHEAMLDELESSMMTTEFISSSPQVQQLFIDRWNQHVFFLQKRAEMQQQAQMSQSMHNAVAQATQQAAAMAASTTVHETQTQVAAQHQQAQGSPQQGQPSLADMVKAQGGGLKGVGQAGSPQQGPAKPPLPFKR